MRWRMTKCKKKKEREEGWTKDVQSSSRRYWRKRESNEGWK